MDTRPDARAESAQDAPTLPVVGQPSETINAHSSVASHSSILPLELPLAGLNSITSWPVLGALAVAIVSLLVLALVRRRRSSTQGSSIILTGPSDAGKTAIHSALVFQQVLPSHTTLQTNISLINISSAEKQKPCTARLVDVPGHPRVRDQFKDHLSEAKAVVFVVDASTIARNGAAVAEHLHHILHALTSLPPSQNPPPLLILAHKSDLLSTSSTSNAALAVSRVRTILERELEKRRASQAGGVGVGKLGDDEDTDAELGGLECSGSGVGGFKFKDWEGGEIEILGSSVKILRAVADSEKTSHGEDPLVGLSEFKEWIQALP